MYAYATALQVKLDYTELHYKLFYLCWWPGSAIFNVSILIQFYC